jgi:hypothetical protein
MATHTGNEGIVKVGANAVAEVRSFTVTETAETVDDTVKGDTYRTKKVTFKSWSGEIGALWDETDTDGQGALSVGAEVTLNLYPEGDSSGDTYLTGAAIITEREITSDLEGLVEASLTVEGNGALTEATVT